MSELDLEEVDDTQVFWVGDRLPPDVYNVAGEDSVAWSTWLPDGQELSWEWHDDDFYAADAAGVFWSWSETKTWLDMCDAPTSDSDPLQEAYASSQDRFRTFKESRALNSAKHLSRGFYPLNQMKGKFMQSKGKSKGKGGKSKSPPQSSLATSAAALYTGGSRGAPSGQKPGSPTYKGCFVCGSQDHDFRRCPKRQSSSSAAPARSLYSASVYMVTSAESDDVADLTCPSGEVLATLAAEFPGPAVLDSGATESIASLEAMREVMELRMRVHGPEQFVVHERQKRFRFGNGSVQNAVSFVELPQTVAGKSVKLGVHALDAPGIPLLLSVKTLTLLKAVIDFDQGQICFKEVDPSIWIQLKRASNGHLLLDLTKDWLHEEPSSSLTVHDLHDPESASTYKVAPAASTSTCALESPHVLRPQLHEPPPHEFFHDRHECKSQAVLHEDCREESPAVHEHVLKSSVTTSLEKNAGMVSNSANPGSSMRAALLFVVAATSSLPWNGFERKRAQGHDSGHQGGAQTISFEEEGCSGPDSREVRLQPPRRSGWERQPSSRISMLWEPHPHAGGTWEPLRPQRPWQVDSVHTMPPSHRVCPRLRSEGMFSSARSVGARCPDSHGDGERRHQGQARDPGESEHEDGQHPWSRSLSAQEVGSPRERQDQAPSQSPCSTGGHQAGGGCGAQCRWSQSSGQARQYSGSRGGRDGELGAGVTGEAMKDYITEETFADPDGQNYVGKLTSSQHESLLEAAEHYIAEAEETFEALFNTTQQIDLMEVCCPPDSRLSQTFLDNSRKAIRVGLPAHDLSRSKDTDEVIKMIHRHRPKVLWISLPCGPYSPIQHLFNETTPEQQAALLLKKKRSRKLIRNALPLVRAQLEEGGQVCWEWPSNNGGWKLPELKVLHDLMNQFKEAHHAHVHGCAYGVKNAMGVHLKKPWKVLCTSYYGIGFDSPLSRRP